MERLLLLLIASFLITGCATSSDEGEGEIGAFEEAVSFSDGNGDIEPDEVVLPPDYVTGSTSGETFAVGPTGPNGP